MLLTVQIDVRCSSYGENKWCVIGVFLAFTVDELDNFSHGFTVCRRKRRVKFFFQALDDYFRVPLGEHGRGLPVIALL